MFSSYRTVYWLSLIMSLFFFAPFEAHWSTDVWMRFVRITEWVAQGFPMHEVLSYAQNAPFGHEMHWTRPLDIIGYVFAWPFIPAYGLKRAIEIMSYFVPLLAFAVGLRGFFYGLKGYVSPKSAFFSFWLFFWSVGYAWSQGAAGYFDHHVFHFALLVWAVALTARHFAVPKNKNLMMAAGMVTALGTWITAEFFINSYLILVPFAVMWLWRGRSLKPAILYMLSYTLTLLVAMSFDHPMAGFLTLDFYRVSLFHVILGGMGVLALLGLEAFHKSLSTPLKRLIWGGAAFTVYGTLLMCFFQDVLLVPMVDPFMHHVWVSKVGEMGPIWDNWEWCVTIGFVPFVVGVWGAITALCTPKRKRMPFLLMSSLGLLFYVALVIFHVRTGVSVNAFFIFTATLFFDDVFFPREKSRRYTVFFVVLYLLFMGVHTRGRHLLIAFKTWGVNHYLELYEKDKNTPIPSYFKDEFEVILAQKEAAKAREQASENTSSATASQKGKSGKKAKGKAADNAVSIADKIKHDIDFQCEAFPESIRDKIISDRQNGVLLTDLFDAPRIVWETGKPVLGGPYHTNVAGLTDLVMILLDQPPFERARHLIEKRGITQVFLTNPKCKGYLFSTADKAEALLTPERYFIYAAYYETKEMPKWLRLVHEDKATKTKLFQVVLPEKSSSAKRDTK